MTLKASDPDSVTAYHCTATWHLARKIRAAELIYSLACVVSKSSHKFFCSAENLAHYLGYERRQIYRGLQELEDAGFLEIVSRQSFQSCVYQVILHKAWAEKHPDGCAIKQSFPWEGEGDELGRKMYALGGGRYRFMQHEVKTLRRTALPEEFILREWEDFIGRWRPLHKHDAKYAFSRFYDVLKVKRGDSNPFQLLVFQLYELSGYIFSGQYKTELKRMAAEYSPADFVERFKTYLERPCNASFAIRAFCAEYSDERAARLRAERCTEEARDICDDAECTISLPM